jgi:hypothetical protein
MSGWPLDVLQSVDTDLPDRRRRRARHVEDGRGKVVITVT